MTQNNIQEDPENDQTEAMRENTGTRSPALVSLYQIETSEDSHKTSDRGITEETEGAGNVITLETSERVVTEDSHETSERGITEETEVGGNVEMKSECDSVNIVRDLIYDLISNLSGKFEE